MGNGSESMNEVCKLAIKKDLMQADLDHNPPPPRYEKDLIDQYVKSKKYSQMRSIFGSILNKIDTAASKDNIQIRESNVNHQEVEKSKLTQDPLLDIQEIDDADQSEVDLISLDKEESEQKYDQSRLGVS